MIDNAKLRTYFEGSLIRFLDERPFFYEVILRFKRIFTSTEVPTAGVNIGRNDLQPKLYINLEGLHGMFQSLGVDTYNRDEYLLAMCGILEHEMIHFCNGHLTNSPRSPDEEELKKCQRGYNLCMDYAINQIVDWQNSPVGGLVKRNKKKIEEYSFQRVEKNREWEYYWKLIKDNIPKIQMFGSGDCGDGQFDQHKWNEEDGDVSGDEGDEQKEINEQIRKKVVKESYESACQRGNVGGRATEIYKKVHHKTLGWKRILRRYAGEVFSRFIETYRRPSRRTQNWPGSTRKRESRFILAVDTSGSISSEIFGKFVEEIKKICTSYGISKFRFIEIDADIKMDEEIRMRDLKSGNIQIKGRGGTVMKPMFEKLKSERNRLPVILFTDGHTDSFKNNYKFPCLWVISPNGTEGNVEGNNFRHVRMKNE